MGLCSRGSLDFFKGLTQEKRTELGEWFNNLHKEGEEYNFHKEKEYFRNLEKEEMKDEIKQLLEEINNEMGRGKY